MRAKINFAVNEEGTSRTCKLTPRRPQPALLEPSRTVNCKRLQRPTLPIDGIGSASQLICHFIVLVKDHFLHPVGTLSE
jgi:hypothetical protein